MGKLLPRNPSLLIQVLNSFVKYNILYLTSFIIISHKFNFSLPMKVCNPCWIKPYFTFDFHNAISLRNPS